MMLADRIIVQDSPSRIDAIASPDARGSRQAAAVLDALSRRRSPAPRVELGLVGAMRRDVAGAGCQLDVTIVNIVNCALQIAPTWVQYRRET
jgi:hypothetical protein